MSRPDRVVFNDFSGLDMSGELSAVQRVLDSGWLVLGNEVRQFEESWAERCGVQHALGVGNGLDAIEIGLRAAGIGLGDEVITTPLTAVASVLGIIRAGATPVLADIDPGTALLSRESVIRCIGPRTRAVLLVHLYGQMRDMGPWQALCDDNGLILAEDCAQAHSAAEAGRVAGSWGSFGAYSFYPTKNLGAAGDAGALVTNDAQLDSHARSLRNYGQSNRYEHTYLGLNSRLDELQAAILSERLALLDGWTSRRRQIAATYRAGLSNPWVRLLDPPIAPENHVNHLFVVTTRDRSGLKEHLAQAGIDTLIHYPIPAHLQGPLLDVGRDPSGLSSAEAHAASCLSLPCAPHLTDDDVERVIEVVNDYRPPEG